MGHPMTVWMKMTLRLPLQVHTALSDEAKRTGSSLNQVIVDRLNASVGGAYISEAEANDARLVQRVSDLEARVAALEKPASVELPEASTSLAFLKKGRKK